MKTRIVPIGNSQGIRIPKVLLEQVGLKGEVELSVDGDSLIIRPAASPRAGWARHSRKWPGEAMTPCSIPIPRLSPGGMRMNGNGDQSI